MSELKGIERFFKVEWMDRSVFTIRYPLEGPSKGTVLILHGLGDHSGRYSWAVDLLHRSGFEVLGIDWPGCGKSSGIRGDLPLVEDAGRMIGEILEELKLSPVGVLAHSTGGFFLSQFLSNSLPAFSSLEWIWFSSPLLDPSYGQSRVKMKAAKLLAKWIPAFTISTGVSPRDCFHTLGDARAREFAEGVHNRISLRFGEHLLDPEKEAINVAGSLDPDLPVLLTVGSADHVCPASVAEVFFNELRSRAKVFVLVSGSRHEPFREPDSAAFFSAVRTWLAAR
ncbi:MAG: alpha/beta fold hydrolase [Verrucomicrobiota bacterium]